MFYSGLLSEGGRKETDMREAASLRQQRRMKQAVQFIHKDSADLLPLDGLKKLGSSKDTVSPRGRARLGMSARGGRSPSRRAAPGAQPWPLSLSHRPGPRSRPSCRGPRSRSCCFQLLSSSISLLGFPSGFRRGFTSSRCLPLALFPSCLSPLASETLPCLLPSGRLFLPVSLTPST